MKEGGRMAAFVIVSGRAEKALLMRAKTFLWLQLLFA